MIYNAINSFLKFYGCLTLTLAVLTTNQFNLLLRVILVIVKAYLGKNYIKQLARQASNFY